MENNLNDATGVYFLSHLGLGDNITNIPAVNFLLEHYKNVYFICQHKHHDNVKLLFLNKPVISSSNLN